MKRFLACSVAALVLGSASFAGAQGVAASAPAAVLTAPAAAPESGAKEAVANSSAGAVAASSIERVQVGIRLPDAASTPADEPAPANLAVGVSAGASDADAAKGAAASTGEGSSLPDIGGLPLARLIEKDNLFTGLGSFKQLLPKYGIASYVHGTALMSLVGQTNPEPEELHDHEGEDHAHFNAEFNLFVGAELFNRVFVEAQLVYDSSENSIESDYANIDFRIFRDFLFVRGGKFWVPMGGINVYPDPLYLFPGTDLPLFVGNVLPGEWGELGVQLYGRYSWGERRGLSYAFYVVNGLEQQVASATDPITGGLMRSMRNNNLDGNDPDKAVGAQLVLEPVPGFTFGLSGYEGVYTVSGKHRLYIVDAHMGLRKGKFTLRGEFATTLQETEAETLVKLGGYVYTSYRFKYVEPLLMLDGIRLDGSHDLDRIQATVGLIAHPFPQKVPSASVRITYAPRWKVETQEFATHHFGVDARVAF